MTDFHILWSSGQRGTTVVGAVGREWEEAYSSPRRLALLEAMAVYRPFRVTLPSSVALLSRSPGQFLKGNEVGVPPLETGDRGRLSLQGSARRENLGGSPSAALARRLQLAELQIILRNRPSSRRNEGRHQSCSNSKSTPTVTPAVSSISYSRAPCQERSGKPLTSWLRPSSSRDQTLAPGRRRRFRATVCLARMEHSFRP